MGGSYAIGTAITSAKPSLIQARSSPKPSPQKQTPPALKLPDQTRRINHVAAAYYGPKPATLSNGSTPISSFFASSHTSGNEDYFGESWVAQGTPPAEDDLSKGISVHYTITSSPAAAPGRSHNAWATNNVSPEERRSSNRVRKPGHTQHRDRRPKGSEDTTGGSSISSIKSGGSRGKGHRSPTQKTMLAKALTKANTAVLLDNAQNFEGAVDAYEEACELLDQVMTRSSDLDDRKKLSAIKSTYSTRIKELKGIGEPSDLNKALPERPSDDETQEAYYEEEELPIMTSDHSRIVNGIAIPPRLESMLPANVEARNVPPSPRHIVEQVIFQQQIKEKPVVQTGLAVPMQSQYMPPPLSPRRPPSPTTVAPSEPEMGDSPERSKPKHARDVSTETTSWLDTVDESGSSHSGSRLSSLDFGTGMSGNLVDEIEAEFDAALNAAVEAAYDDDREKTPVAGIKTPKNAVEPASQPPSPNVTKQPPRSISRTQEQTPVLSSPEDTLSPEFDEDAEEERLLDEMTRGYGLEDFHFDSKSKSALPRQSDSSSFSGRTWGSSVASTTLTSGTTLSTLAEGAELPLKLKASIHSPTASISPILPKGPEASIPPVPSMPPPPAPISRPSSIEKSLGQGVRDRRLSGQNAKQLKIETFAKSPVIGQQTTATLAPLPRIQVPIVEEVAKQPQGDPMSTSSITTGPITPMTSIHSADSLASESPAASLPAQGGSQDSVDETPAVPPSPGKLLNRGRQPANLLRKNMSSSSLKMRNLSLTTAENDSPITPGSATFPSDNRRPYTGTHPPIPTPTGTNFHVGGTSIGGMYLFDDQIGAPLSPRTPRTPRTQNPAPSIPLPLEACPESFLLRPFWLMRALYQSIAHPRGGYLTTKLFIPRDIWKVKNVKLKAVEDKVSQCDLLTAALLKLANVDNFDADAVYEELQSFESVMDQVRNSLTKKLGTEVGLSGTAALFKNSPSIDVPSDAVELRSTNASAKNSFASSWRKLRSKSSGAQINHVYSGAPLRDPGTASHLTMSTIPMTSSADPTPSARHVARRIPPSNVNLSGMGLLSNYMSSLARLFDSAQVLDQIARQVEDPGLKHSSQTHVGLELSLRAAAEFFSFYILRFVLGDVGTLLDKFVKRGGEWVLA